jgi:AraC-like DNA-binding protein
LLWIYRGTPPAYSRDTWVNSPFLSAYLVVHGEITVRNAEQEITGRQGQWLFPGQGRRWQHYSADARLLSIRIYAKWPTGEDLFERGLGIVLNSSEVPNLEKTAWPLLRFVDKQFPDRGVDLMSTSAPLVQQLQLQQLFNSWLIAMIEALAQVGVRPTCSGQIDERVAAIAKHLDCIPINTAFNEGDLAKQVGMSVSQIRRLFTAQFSIGPKQYFDRRRLHAAIMTLEGTTESVKAMSYALGFSSPPHFIHWFRARTGTTPAAYRSINYLHPVSGFDIIAKPIVRH